MYESYCKEPPQLLPSYAEVKDLRWTIVANCAFNNFVTYTAIMVNLVTMVAIRKTSSLGSSMKTLLLSLAVSDVGVGLLVQPSFTSLLVSRLQQTNRGCFTYVMFIFFANLFAVASLLGVVAVSVDRFLAVQFHLRYRELVTHKRVVAVVISIWVFSAFASLIILSGVRGIQNIIALIVGVVSLLVTTVVYIKVYFVARRHKNHIQSLQVQQVEQTGEIAEIAGLIKSAVGISYVYLVFLVCYLPFIICLATLRINGSSIALKRFYLFSLTLVFLNSSLNPVIYCWKMRHIRHAIMDILRNVSWNRNRATC